MLFVCSFIQAQLSYTSNLRSKKIATISNIKIDTVSLVPNSFTINNVDTSFYSIDNIHSNLIWKKQLSTDSVEITYRVFDFNFSKTYQLYNYDSIKNNFMAEKPLKYNVSDNSQLSISNNQYNFGKINYSGSFGRNISFGNNQDAVFNSQLNLQMNGIIGDSILLAAAITDNNIPIQPDGTTQRINEFDKILLQFKKKNWQLSLGDIDLKQNQNYFLNFYKRLQGVSLSIDKTNKNKFNFTGAIAKGKFTRYVFNGQEGNQGPYRLQGANNEIYFIVLAATERVFIDGELMKRGEDLDYIINYNTGEILFTSKRMITKDKRIQIEFEYAERSYLNGMFYVSNESLLSKKIRLSIAAYSNADAKNSPINQQLDTKQKQFLADLGNDYQKAFYPYENIDSFSSSKILYAKRPSPISISDSIYVYSTNKDSAKYSLYFTEVGANKGNYISLFNATNGKAYQWITPVNNIPQGNFEPAQFLVTPKKQQIITVATDYQINKNTLFKTEAAFSNYDVNTLSSLNKSDNKGFAGKFILQKNNRINKDLNLNSSLSYEYVEQNFKTVERLRSVEFSRHWGLPIIPNAATEHIPKAVFELKDKQSNSLSYTVESYLRSDDYKGIRQTLLHHHLVNNFTLNNSISYVGNSTPLTNGYFFKPSIEITKLFKTLASTTLGASYSLEHNQQQYKFNDSLLPTSFAFEIISAFLKSNQQKANKWSLNYFTRTDKLPTNKNLMQVDRSNNYSLTTELLKNANHQFKFNITYRELIVQNSNLSSFKPDNSLLGRVEYNINEWNGFVSGFVLYELGAGQEQKRDFSYYEVPAGRGQYTWNDYNNDGIAQLNEFELAQFADQAKYIRIFTPTNQFIKANYTTFNYNVNISPQRISSKIKNLSVSKIVSRFNIISSLQTNKKIISDGELKFNPFEKNISDTALINLTNIFSNTISFNRSSAKWGIDISNTSNNNKALLTYGLESRQLIDWTIRSRINFRKEYSIELVNKWGTNQLITPSFNNRNYSINNISVEPKLIYTYLSKYRIQTSYQVFEKQNSIDFGGESVRTKSLIIDAKYNAMQSGSITAKFTYSNINFTGTNNTTISYIMLEGLQAGKNYLWNIEFTKRLNNNFEISFNYEGRKAGESRTINIGRASVRAIL
ncbi:MAG: hypothetical protein NTZ59_04150 [Bacteroidetes bacterium]|nr:hypothetical protein [Bacteroidota bacterium]